MPSPLHLAVANRTDWFVSADDDAEIGQGDLDRAHRRREDPVVEQAATGAEHQRKCHQTEAVDKMVLQGLTNPKSECHLGSNRSVDALQYRPVSWQMAVGNEPPRLAAIRLATAFPSLSSAPARSAGGGHRSLGWPSSWLESRVAPVRDCQRLRCR